MEVTGNSWKSHFLEKLIRPWIRPQAWPRQALNVPYLQAHRGFWKSGARENTMAAFRAARQAGAQMSELDVRLSQDHIPVVFHDEDLTCLGGGDSSKVSDLTARELYRRAQIPSLEDVLTDPEGTPLYNIETKSNIWLDDSLERRVVAVVHRCGASSRVLFSSFNPMSLVRLGSFAEHIPLALLVGSETEQVYLREMWLAPFLKFHLLHLQEDMLTPKGALESWSAQGVPVSAWTVNDPHTVGALLRRGAQSVISDSILRVDQIP